MTQETYWNEKNVICVYVVGCGLAIALKNSGKNVSEIHRKLLLNASVNEIGAHEE